jgi:hypothetical protein
VTQADSWCREGEKERKGCLGRSSRIAWGYYRKMATLDSGLKLFIVPLCILISVVFLIFASKCIIL